MPTILYEQGFRFSFYSADRREPPHIHVTKDRSEAKWWLNQMEEAWSRGYTASDRRKIRGIIRDYQGYFLAQWHRYFPEAEG